MGCTGSYDPLNYEENQKEDYLTKTIFESIMARRRAKIQGEYDAERKEQEDREKELMRQQYLLNSINPRGPKSYVDNLINKEIPKMEFGNLASEEQLLDDLNDRECEEYGEDEKEEETEEEMTESEIKDKQAQNKNEMEELKKKLEELNKKSEEDKNKNIRKKKDKDDFFGKKDDNKENEEENLFINRKTSEDNDLINEIKNEINKLETNRAEAEEAYNKRPNKKKTDPPFDDNMYYRFSDELMSKILNRRLQENDSTTYGFILDGFPKNYKQIEKLFKEGEKSISYPNSILLYEDIEDDICINRIKNSEEVLKDPKDPKVNILLERANRRLAKIKEEKGNEDYKSLRSYFEEEENNKIFKDKLMMIDGKDKSILDIIKISQEFIIKNNENKINAIDEGLDCNDYLYDYIKIEEDKIKQKEEEQNINNNEKKEIKENKEEEKENEEIKKEEQNNEKEIKEEKKEENEEKKEEEKPKSKLEIEKENEFKLLEKKSEVLRRYLAENVLPLLSLGILHVANERPDDPVEALADYLLAKTFEIKKNEDMKENNGNENNKEEKNESIDLNGDKKGVDLHFEDKNENNGEKITRKLSPIHRENSEQILQDKNENGEDDLNKAMIESNE